MSINPGPVDAHTVVLLIFRTAKELGAVGWGGPVGDETQSVASGDRLGTGGTDGVGSKIGTGVAILSTKRDHPRAEY